MSTTGAREGVMMPRGADGYTGAERLVMEVLRPCVLKLTARGAIWGAVYGSIVALPLLYFFPIGTILGCLLGTAAGLLLGLVNGLLLAIVLRLTYSPLQDARRYRARLLLLCAFISGVLAVTAALVLTTSGNSGTLLFLALPIICALINAQLVDRRVVRWYVETVAYNDNVAE